MDYKKSCSGKFICPHCLTEFSFPGGETKSIPKCPYCNKPLEQVLEEVKNES